MNQSEQAVVTSPLAASVPGTRRTGPRVEIYAAAHKGLRALLSDLLMAMGRASFDVPRDVAKILGDLEATLRTYDRHIEQEDTYLRPAIAERAVSTVATIDGEHRAHTEDLAELRAIAAALRGAATTEEQLDLGRTLYLHFSVFVAETLVHMAYEERVVQPLLDLLLPATELQAIHEAIIKSTPPAEGVAWLRVLIRSSNPAERARILGEVRAKAPPDAFASLVRGLSAEDRADLDTRLGP